MPNTDPIQTLISQGYPPATAKQIVESGGFDALQTGGTPLFPTSVTTPSSSNTPPPIPGIGGSQTDTAVMTEEQTEFSRDPEIQALIKQGYTREEAYQMRAAGQLPTEGEQAPNSTVQAFLDQGYNREEAEQLAQSEFHTSTLGQNTDPQTEATTATENTKGLFETALDFSGSIGGVNDMETSAYRLGQSIGMEKGTKGRGLAIAGNAGKLAFSGARNIASGLGQAKRSQYVQDYYEKKRQEGTGRETYTAAPQYQNENYLGGNSFGEDGGTKGKNLPLKQFLANGGFKKPGYKKL